MTLTETINHELTLEETGQKFSSFQKTAMEVL